MALTYHSGRRIQSVPNEYKVHEFTSSGTLAVTGSGDIEYLVVAGGGGGYCGGGGAGGMRTGTLSVSAGNKTVTVGAGGYSGQCNVNGHGNNGVGGDSVFDSITSTGGGFGGGTGAANNTAGGSSGGAGGNYTSNGGYPQDSVTPNQGNNGGASDGTNSQRAGAGGGAGAVGGNATSGVAVGGDGLASSISGSSVIYAGGGGGGFANSSSGTGGVGGSGGGGSDGAAGATNLGAGGGGHDNSARAGYGGSGIVIVRYLTSSGITATGGTITTINAHDARPLNVQLESRLEETDTRKMYYLQEASTATYSDFTGTWTSDSGNEVQASNGVVSVNMGGSNRNDYISFDLGSTLSDSWTLRFKQQATTNSFTLNSGNAGAMYVSLSSGTNLSGEHNDGGSVDSLMTRIRHQSTQWKMETFDVRSRVSGTTTSSGDAGQVLSTGAQTYYVEVIKDGATTSVKYFDDSGFSSQVGTTKSVSSNSIGTNLQYIGVHIFSESHSSGDFVAEVSEIKIYDGITSVLGSNTWSELGT